MKLSYILKQNYMLMSQLYRPVVKRPKNTQPEQEMLSQSQRLLLDMGLMNYTGSRGLLQLLPAAVRALTKLTNLIDRTMDDIGAQRVALSALLPKTIMEKSGRYSSMHGDLFELNDRNNIEFCLAPTHEESIAKLLTEAPPMSSARFPLLLYQITNKYRDERNPRFGLLRSREFLMKDLYSFDVDENRCFETYERVCLAYERLFERLQLPTYRVRATSGAMGGVYSHEFHLANSCGQDEILHCPHCSSGINVELLTESGKTDDGRQVQHEDCGRPMDRLRTIEVAHTFVLGTKYTEAFETFYTAIDGERKLLHMACFGIGVSRLLAACIDCFTKNMQIRWPLPIAPYKVCVVPPKKGSKEDAVGTPLAFDVAESLCSLFEPGDVLFDDRTDLTVGYRLKDLHNFGCPYVVVINKTAVADGVPKFELYDLTKEDHSIVTHEELFWTFRSLE